MRTSAEERLRNRVILSQLRAAIKELRDEKDREKAKVKLREVTSFLDRAADRHIIHKRNADRNKARLAQMVNRLRQ
jgi:small subunit ribosomal protein S20